MSSTHSAKNAEWMGHPSRAVRGEGRRERERGEARHGLIVSRNFRGGKYGDGTRAR